MTSNSTGARMSRWGAALALLAGLALMAGPSLANEQFSFPTTAAFQTTSDSIVIAPTDLRFRKTASEVVLLWDQVDAATEWNVHVNGDRVATVFEQRFTVTQMRSPHTVTAVVNGRESGPSRPLTFFEDNATSESEVDPEPTPPVAEPAEPTGPDEPTDAGGPTAEPADPASEPVELVLGQDDSPIPSSWTRPAQNSPYVDPTYGTSIRRISSAEGTRFNRNDYSRRQAENADGSLFFTYHGDASFHVYDRTTTDEVQILAMAPGAEPQWHPTNPTAIRHVEGSNSYVGDLQLFETDVTSGETRTIADLGPRIKARYPDAQYMNDRAEGSPSADGDRYAWIVWNGDEERVGVVSYDLGTDTILGFTDIKDGDIDGNGFGLLDYVSMSPSGTHVIAGYWYGTFVYDADLTNERQINAKGDHSDIAIGADGVDHYVYIDFSATSYGGWLVSVNLNTLERTRIFDLYRTKSNTSVHVSGKGYNKPGWVVVSTYSCKVDVGWACEKVMAVEIAGEKRIVNLAHTQNCGEEYWTEPHASVNRDFTRIYFNSDAGSCGIDAEVYEISVPPLP